MNIKQIETFVRIVELGTFQAAADDLNASVSTVSARVRELEEYVGDALFDRTFHRAELTARGHALFEQAKQLVTNVRSLSLQWRNPRKAKGILRMGAVGLVAMTWLPKLLEGCRSRHPLLSLRVEVGLTQVLVSRLLNGKLDCAIIAGASSDHGLKVEPIGTDDFVWMQGPGSSPSFSRTIAPVDIATRDVLALGEDSYHHAILTEWFGRRGVGFEPAITCTSMAVLAELVMRGNGVALLPRNGYRDQLRTGALREIQVEPRLPSVQFALAYRRVRTPEALASLLDLARTVSALPDTA